MKIVVTGSLGHISKPLTIDLVKRGHRVTVISSKTERQKEIESLGAIAAIGTVEDVTFLTDAFTGADIVFSMVPPGNYLNQGRDLMAEWRGIGNNLARAIEASAVKRVIHLSSIGAHLEKGSGIIIGHHDIEVILSKLSDVAITFMRPVGFYYNLFGFVPMIKKEGLIAANYGAEEQLVWVSPLDIADAIAEEMKTPPVGRKVRYVASDELTGNETAAILGAAIGKPDLKWILISDEQRQKVLEAVGLNADIAAGLVEMFSAQHSGLLMEDYYRHKPVLGKVKLTDFAKEFATAFK
jgi:uncharacterized protein YbjT (DUF2867 family)